VNEASGSRHARRDAWAAARLLRELRHRFTEGMHRVGRDGWRAWLRTVALGAAALLLLMLGLMAAAQRLSAAGLLAWEREFLLWLGERGPFSFASAVFFQTFGTDITLVILIAATAGFAAWCRRPITALSIVLAPLVVDLIGRVSWSLWHRARPDVLWDGIASPGFHSFPSGHTSKTTATYGFLALLWIAASGSVVERVLVLLALAFVVTVTPLGRMTIGVHWPSDIAGGFVIGVAWLAVLRFGLRYERGYTASSRTGRSPDSAARMAR
jgi:undecaprenyl-diphosphatase